MTDRVTLVVGSNPSAPYVAYGDDSQFGDSLAFAYVVLARDQLHRAVTRLRILREKFRIPDEVGVHCRVLFSEDSRARKGLSHLRKSDVESIVDRAVSIINKIPMQIRYAICDLEDFKKFHEVMGGQLPTLNKDGGDPTQHQITIDPKGIIGLLAQLCFAASADGKNGPPASDCEIFVARDETKVKLFGDRKSKAHRTYAGFSEIGAPLDSTFRVEPTVVDPSICEMLEFADIVAYVVSHAYAKNTNNELFVKQLKRIRHWVRSAYVPYNKTRPET